MNACPALSLEGAGGLARALAALDCRTGAATAFAFDRLFGPGGRLLPALTILLTLYIGFFAVSLLTGRSRLGLSALTPRMMTIGLALTFATSWAAYQGTIWTLATGAPDEVASLLVDDKGSATAAFADRLDALFGQVSDAADAAGKPAPATATGITPATPMVGGFTAGTVLGLSGLMLLLGTVGVLVTAKIALAALLAVGPLFIVLALFGGTRGLFEGWLKAVVLFALVPLFAVLIGGGAVEALTPVAADLAMAGAEPDTRAVAALFVGAAIYLALMIMVVKMAATIVGTWRLPGGARETAGRSAGGAPAQTVLPPVQAPLQQSGPAGAMLGGGDRVRSIVAALPALSAERVEAGSRGDPGRARALSAQIVPIGGGSAWSSTASDPRLRGVGSRFRERPTALAGRRVS